MRKLLWGLSLFMLVLLAGCTSGGIGERATQGAGEIALRGIVPASDVRGEDIADIPRPQGFVRSEFEKEPGYIRVTYRAIGDRFDEVYDFYRSEMPKNGWELSGESAESGVSVEIGNIAMGVEKGGTLTFVKDSYAKTASIEVVVGSVMGKKITEVSVTYEESSEEGYENNSAEESQYKPLNAEPYNKDIPIYQGAVLFDRSRVTLGSVSTTVDKYFVKNGDIGQIFDFYDSRSEIAGYPKVVSELDNDSGTIYFGNPEGEGITINLERDGNYVVIEITRIAVAG